LCQPLKGRHEHGTSPLLMLPLMDVIPSRRNSLRDGKINRTFSSYAQFFQLLRSMKVKLFSNLMLVFPKFTIKFLTKIFFYLEAFDGIFGVFLKNEDPQNMEEVQVVAIKLERNYLATCELPLIHVPDQLVNVTPFYDLQPLVVTEV
jgi:hypothetical protein